MIIFSDLINFLIFSWVICSTQVLPGLKFWATFALVTFYPTHLSSTEFDCIITWRHTNMIDRYFIIEISSTFSIQLEIFNIGNISKELTEGSNMFIKLGYEFSIFESVIGPAGQQTYRAIVLINPATAAATAPFLLFYQIHVTKISITQSIFKLGARNFACNYI